ncbi:MAG: VCBS repeat-containing protein [bacterium]|nr:VCBS repeat-containing protein [bacterium]
MNFRKLVPLIIAVLLLTVSSPPDASAQRSFEKGVRIMSDGKPIDVDIGHSVPTVADWNNDGKKDLIVGQFGKGKIRLYLNNGTDSKPAFTGFEYLKAGGKMISLPSG